MINLVVFTGSCGHVTFSEVDDAKFEALAAPRIIKTLSGDKVHKNELRVGRRTRAVYVTPFRFTLCQDCVHENYIDLLLADTV